MVAKEVGDLRRMGLAGTLNANVAYEDTRNESRPQVIPRTRICRDC